MSSAATSVSPSGARPRSPRGPLAFFLDLFSSVWLGMTLLSLLFIYMSLGSSGVPVGRGMLEWPFLLRPDAWVSVRELFELSEFQWFHWWPFDLLIGLICLNLTVATFRRIRFNVVNLGVWMIHTGIIVLCIGSVWYFATKVEGDTPVARRTITASIDGSEPIRFLASPGARAIVEDDTTAYRLSVQGITPSWELLSGEDKGKFAYKVSVAVEGPNRRFIRELIAGFPEYTEDLIFTEDPNQPVQRAKKALGTALVDPDLQLGLEFAPQEWFYLMESAAIYVREVGSDTWVERPIEKLPRFKDYVADSSLVWFDPAVGPPTPRPLSIDVPAVADDDPAPGLTLRVDAALRYASMQTRRRADAAVLDPHVELRFTNDEGQRQDHEMLAFDPSSNSLGGGNLIFRWIDREEQLEALRRADPPMLRIAVGDADVESAEPVIAQAAGDTGAFIAIPDSPYAYRVRAFQDQLALDSGTVSVAIVDIRVGDEEFTRWVFDDPALTRDLTDDGSPGAHGSELRAPDLDIRYAPGQPSGLRLVAGPEPQQLRLFVPTAPGEFDLRNVVLGQAETVAAGVQLTVRSYAARSRAETRPFVVPIDQRNRDVGIQASMVRVRADVAGDDRTEWLPYHVYPFRNRGEVLRRFPYSPTRLTLADGREIEMLFSRERMRLPRPVVLEDFEFQAHVGGFSGATTSIRNWTSVLRFADDQGSGWAEPVNVSVNAPQEDHGFWYFQSQWDPPQEATQPGGVASAGLNYTVLGVGNREGVLVQLFGCILSVIGMIYAFYVKPAIKRRRQLAVYENVVRAKASKPEMAVAGVEN